MRRTWLLLALCLGSCSTQRHIERQELRTDTFRAVIAEQLNVCLDDVVIIPPDTIRPVIVARKVELRREAAAELVNTAAEEIKTDETPATPPAKPPLWPLALLAAFVILWLKK